MGKLNDLTGKKIGCLKVLKRDHTDKHYHIYYLCECDCGNIIPKSSASILKNLSYCSNDCLMHYPKHDFRLNKIWHAMKRRCTHKKAYIDKNITVCDEWANDFIAFRDWAYKNGYDKTADFFECTIDRIDNSKGYSPSNCRFIDNDKQQNNRDNNIRINYKGINYTITDLIDKYNIPLSHKAVYGRIKRGHNVEDIINYKTKKTK